MYVLRQGYYGHVQFSFFDFFSPFQPRLFEARAKMDLISYYLPRAIVHLLTCDLAAARKDKEKRIAARSRSPVYHEIDQEDIPNTDDSTDFLRIIGLRLPPYIPRIPYSMIEKMGVQAYDHIEILSIELRMIPCGDRLIAEDPLRIAYHPYVDEVHTFIEIAGRSHSFKLSRPIRDMIKRALLSNERQAVVVRGPRADHSVLANTVRVTIFDNPYIFWYIESEPNIEWLDADDSLYEAWVEDRMLTKILFSGKYD